MKTQIHILITIPPGSYEQNCTLVFESIRTGFPNAEIHTYLNTWDISKTKLTLMKRVGDVCLLDDLTHHYEWIQQVLEVNKNLDSPLIFLDGDVIFWDNCEHVCQNLMNGFYVPSHINDFSDSFYFSRLHTSFLCFRSPKELWSVLNEINVKNRYLPQAHPYLPSNPFAPEVLYINNKRVFYDTCAKLFQQIGDARVFGEDILNRYDHLNSSSFLEVMKQCLPEPDQTNFLTLQQKASENPLGAKGLYKSIQKYYNSRAITLHDYLYPSN
jgi:hypothetical protein